jgi:hypothetical protein
LLNVTTKDEEGVLIRKSGTGLPCPYHPKWIYYKAESEGFDQGGYGKFLSTARGAFVFALVASTAEFLFATAARI